MLQLSARLLMGQGDYGPSHSPPSASNAQARDLLCEAWAAGRRPGRAEAAFFRAAAYLHAGAPQQALKDARVALAYGPRPDDYSTGSGGGGGSSGALITTVAGTVADATVGAVPADPQLRSAWPAALAALAGAHEGLADNVPAALAMQRALELDPGNEDYAEALERLLRRIPEDCAAALQVLLLLAWWCIARLHACIAPGAQQGEEMRRSCSSSNHCRPAAPRGWRRTWRPPRRRRSPSS